MKTRKILVPACISLLLLLVATLSFGCYNFPENRSTGKYIKETRDVRDFSALDVGGAFKVVLSQGDVERLELEADEGEIGDIVTEVVGKELKIYMKPGWKGNYHEMTVYLTFKTLERAEFSGAAEVSGTGPLRFDGLALDVSGAAEIRLEMTADRIDADFTGASEVAFTGKIGKGRFEISGASELDAENMEFGSLSMEVSGAADARVFVTEELYVEASGASTIRYKGNPRVAMDVSGASSVKPM